MELKKILALAMLALMVIPSLTIVVRADGPDEGVGLAGAIERARLYLDKVRAAAVATAEQYEGEPDHVIHGYLNDLLDLIGEDWEDDPDFLLEPETYSVAELSEDKSHSGNYSVHLETTGTPKDGDEARIVIPMPEGFTLGDLKTLSWWEYLVTGYPPHVDVYLELGEHDDSLNFEYANNGHYDEPPMPYGALTGNWYQTFGDDDRGPDQIDDAAFAWPNAGPAGPGTDEDFELHTLADWKEGITYTVYGVTRTINASCIVTRLEIEVDNWMVQTEAYVDDIKIKGVTSKGVTYDFEEEHEGLGAEGYLDRASAYLDANDNKSAARSHASARNILGRVNGLLKSMAKAHKVARAERFERKFERRIQGIRDKIERPKGPKPK